MVFCTLFALLACCADPGIVFGVELQKVTVKPGDTLWSLANFYLKDPTRWNEILKYNRQLTSDPSVTLPGRILNIPVYLIKEKLRAARLISFSNDVRYRKYESPDWKSVRLRMDLFQNDSLRTRAKSRAKVRFYSGEILSIFSNSIAVLRPPYKRTDVELLKGEVRGIRARVLTASARITPKTPDTDYSTRITEDLTTLVQVYKGRADVEAQGKVVEVLANFAVTVPLDMPPSTPVRLPPMAEFSKGSGTKLARGAGPSIHFDGTVMSLKVPASGKAGTPGGGPRTPGAGDVRASASGRGENASTALETISVGSPIQGYHLQIARKRNFAKLVVDKQYSAFDRIDLKKILPVGTYWVQISLIDLLGLEGKFTSPKQIRISAVPPVLEVYSPKPGEKVYQPALIVEGRTDRDAKVNVGGRAAVTDSNGMFSVTLRLKEGANDIKIVSVGKQGLKTRVTRTVNYAKTKAPLQELTKKPSKGLFAQFMDAVGGGGGLAILLYGAIVLTVVLIFLL